MARPRQQVEAGLGRYRPVRIAVQQRGAEMLFEQRDALTDSRWSEVLGARRTGDGTLFGDADQALEVTYIHAFQCSQIINKFFITYKILNVIFLLFRVLASTVTMLPAACRSDQPDPVEKPCLTMN
jgi:hypothetical protein